MERSLLGLIISVYPVVFLDYTPHINWCWYMFIEDSWLVFNLIVRRGQLRDMTRFVNEKKTLTHSSICFVPLCSFLSIPGV